MVQDIGASVLHSCYVPQVTVVERYSLVLSAQHFCHSSIWTFLVICLWLHLGKACEMWGELIEACEGVWMFISPHITVCKSKLQTVVGWRLLCLRWHLFSFFFPRGVVLHACATEKSTAKGQSKKTGGNNSNLNRKSLMPPSWFPSPTETRYQQHSDIRWKLT